MDDLADAVGVSRRTLFNHFASKEDTIFGFHDDDCDKPESAFLDDFLAGRPSGRLLTDLIHLCAQSIQQGDDPVTSADVHEMITVLHHNPSLRTAFQRRLDDVVQELSDPVAQRLSTTPEDPRCRLAVQVVRGIVLEAAQTYAASNGDRPLADILTEFATIVRRFD